MTIVSSGHSLPLHIKNEICVAKFYITFDNFFNSQGGKESLPYIEVNGTPRRMSIVFHVCSRRHWYHQK